MTNPRYTICRVLYPYFFCFFAYFKVDHVYISLNWPDLEFLCYVWGPEVGGIAHLQSQGEDEAANPRCPRNSNPGPLDPKSSVLPLSHRPPYTRIAHCKFQKCSGQSCALTRALERGSRFCPPLVFFFINIFRSIRSIAVIFSVPA